MTEEEAIPESGRVSTVPWHCIEVKEMDPEKFVIKDAKGLRICACALECDALRIIAAINETESLARVAKAALSYCESGKSGKSFAEMGLSPGRLIAALNTLPAHLRERLMQDEPPARPAPPPWQGPQR